MGQHFHLTAPRVKETLSWSGKLGEILFDGSVNDFVHLLAVPVLPEIPAPSTPAQPQNDDNVAAGDALPEIRAESRAKRKAVSEALVSSSRHCKRARAEGNSATIVDLPPELHQLIFSHIEYIEDVICLGLTSRFFWTLAREHMHDYFASFLGKWAGENIVCVGEYVKPGDFPPGLFSTEEADDINQWTVNYSDDEGNPDDVEHPAEPFTLYHFTSPSFSKIEKEIDVDSEACRIFFNCQKRGGHADPAFDWACSEIMVEKSTYLPKDQVWILRNLTTKEYVRSEAIALRPEFISGPDIAVLGFGEVVVSRICWSTDDSVSMIDPSNISRGVWAGHRFDIVTIASHRDEIEGPDWRDVSDEVASEIASIWESQYGLDWRQTLCDSRHRRY